MRSEKLQSNVRTCSYANGRRSVHAVGSHAGVWEPEKTAFIDGNTGILKCPDSGVILLKLLLKLY